MQPTAEAVAIKAGAATVGVATVAPAIILGVEGGTLLAACAGALFALAYSKPEAWGRVLDIPPGPVWFRIAQGSGRALAIAFSVAGNAFLAGWIVAAIPHVAMAAAVAAVPQVPMAGLLAFGAQRLVPVALRVVERKLDSRGRT